jgi:hypothetical protein
MHVRPLPGSPHPGATAARSTVVPGEPREAAGSRATSLWEILTPEERAFFAEQAALGPLSYRPGTATAPAIVPTGQRLDVRA